MVSFTCPKGKYFEELNVLGVSMNHKISHKHLFRSLQELCSCASWRHNYFSQRCSLEGVGFLALATVYKTYAAK